MNIRKSTVNSCQRFEKSRSRSMRYQTTQYSLGLGASASTSRKRLIRRGGIIKFSKHVGTLALLANYSRY